MRFVNRTAVTVTPKDRFLDWLHAADSTSGRITLKRVQREPTIYLLPEGNDDIDATRQLRKVCGEIFEHELDAWYRDITTWPTERGFSEFRTWFDYSFHSVVIDLGGTRLITEDV